MTGFEVSYIVHCADCGLSIPSAEPYEEDDWILCKRCYIERELDDVVIADSLRSRSAESATDGSRDGVKDSGQKP